MNDNKVIIVKYTMIMILLWPQASWDLVLTIKLKTERQWHTHKKTRLYYHNMSTKIYFLLHPCSCRTTTTTTTTTTM
jgi:hypothetical protein